MSRNVSSENVRPFTVLLLDGGGVRGLSSLLILRKLMERVNYFARQRGYDSTELTPTSIFDFVAGTSTGGLIAIMMGKLGMTVQDCINAYQQLSWRVFGKKTLRGGLSAGLARARFRGKNLTIGVRELLSRHNLQKEHPMVKRDEGKDPIKCAVVCREHVSSSKYDEFRNGPAVICSQPCTSFNCTVCEAARATSAAFTYFPIKQIGDRYFSDGGVGYNNPSHAIWSHYTLKKRIESTKRQSQVSSTKFEEALAAHTAHDVGSLDNVTLVNIGTGSNLEDTPDRKRDNLTHLLPGMIRFGIFLKTTLQEVATQAENTAEYMESIVAANPEALRYTRLSASTGVCWIKLYRYDKLGEIEQLTNDWLQQADIEKKIDDLALELAEEWRVKQRSFPNQL